MSKGQMQLVAIGTIHTPYSRLEECPRNINLSPDKCHISVSDEYRNGLEGLHQGDRIEILYWLDQAHYSSAVQTSRESGELKGVFALRTPNRPNPIGSAVIRIESIEDARLTVRGLDCLDGTALLDIKPTFKS